MQQDYVAQWDFKSSLGQLTKGKTYTFFPELADHYNRSSPGVLVKAKAKSKAPRKTRKVDNTRG